MVEAVDLKGFKIGAKARVKIGLGIQKLTITNRWIRDGAINLSFDGTNLVVYREDRSWYGRRGKEDIGSVNISLIN